MTTQEHVWIKTSDSLPQPCELVLTENLLPLDNTRIQKICFDVAFYIDAETEYKVDEDEDLLELGSYETDEDGSIYLTEGWYRVFDDWRGRHIQSIGEVTRWMSFSRR